MAKSKDSSDDEGPIRANAMEERARKNLCAFIEASGYSATQVADMAGVPQANLGRYMRGDTSIPAEALRAISLVLGRDSTDDFYEISPPEQRTAAELEAARPIFAKSRPGFEPTEEDLADFEEFLAKVRARREKKKPKK